MTSFWTKKIIFTSSPCHHCWIFFIHYSFINPQHWTITNVFGMCMILIYHLPSFPPCLIRPFPPFHLRTAADRTTTGAAAAATPAPTSHTNTTEFISDVLMMSMLMWLVYNVSACGERTRVWNKSRGEYITGFNTTRYGANWGAMLQVLGSPGPRVQWRAGAHQETVLH